jgi:FdhD protein
MIPPAYIRLPRLQHRTGGELIGTRAVPEEVPIAFSYRGCSYAVMMATPSDFDDFAIGFSLTEGLARTKDEIEGVTVRPQDEGLVLDIDLAASAMDRFWSRRRVLAGPSGCGLCGVESIAQALRPVMAVTGAQSFSAEQIREAVAAIPRHQSLNRETRAVHAAALWQPDRGIVALREDVGRHNALDKLMGALASRGICPTDNVLLLTSRISVELVQKACAAGATMIVAVSAPTALAIRIADAAGVTLIGVARDDGFEVFTHPDRVQIVASSDAAEGCREQPVGEKRMTQTMSI